MECLSTVSFRALLPNFIQNFFTRNDDDSFRGGEEDEEDPGPVIHIVNTPYVRTRTVEYEPEHENPTIASNESSKKL